MAERRHWFLRAVLLLAVLLAVGEGVPRFTVGNDLQAYSGIPDAHAVALAADAQARAPYAGTLGRLIFPAAHVRVWMNPDHCTAHHGDESSKRRQYEARVQLYTLFDIRGPQLHVRCGGSESSWIWGT